MCIGNMKLNNFVLLSTADYTVQYMLQYILLAMHKHIYYKTHIIPSQRKCPIYHDEQRC